MNWLTAVRKQCGFRLTKKRWSKEDVECGGVEGCSGEGAISDEIRLTLLRTARDWLV